MRESEDRSYPIREDMKFQRRSWAVERIGWIGMGIVVVAALLGVFFHGPVSYTTASTSDEVVAVDYERFAHKTATSHFTIRVSPATARDLPVRARESGIRLSPPFARNYDIEAMEPRPVRSNSGVDGLEFVFTPSSAGDLVVHIAARAKRFGFASIDIEVEGRGALRTKQLIYP